MNHPSVEIFGVKIAACPVESVIQSILTAAEAGEKKIFAYANIHGLNLAYEQPAFHAFYDCAALTFCDGFGVRLGARLLGQDLPYRYTPPDWFPELARICAERGISLYLLGARPGVAQKFASQLQEHHSRLQIAGVQHGYFDRTPGSAGNERTLNSILASQPGILVVGFGMPLQEYWILDNLDRLPGCAILPVGAMFDYLTGETRRAPRWMTDRGLEWLGRLLIEPGRLWKRYIIGNPIFLLRVLHQRFFRR